MILSGRKIAEAVKSGDIQISPFDKKQINPNSYNLRLHNELLTYRNTPLDAAKENSTEKLTIPESGIVLLPNRLYLARTVEYTKTNKYVPMLEGRSSVGRLGLFVHVSAGFGDIGFSGYWTLEIVPTLPVKIYPGMQICQIYFHTICGEADLYTGGKYQNNTGIQPSLMYEEFAT